MFILGNFIYAVAYVLDIVLTLYMWLIIIRAILSWVNADPYNPIVRFIVVSTDFVLEPIRVRLPYFGPFDLSPVVAILLIIFLKNFLVSTLFDIASRLKGM